MNKKLLLQLTMITFILLPMLLMVNKKANAGWSTMNSRTTNDLRGVWGTSETNVYAAGLYGTFLHYDGDGDNDGTDDDIWEAISSPGGRALIGIWGTSETDIYVVGNDLSPIHGYVMYYDTSGWDTLYDTIGVFRDIWGSSASDIFVAGNKAIYHYNGSVWTFSSFHNDYSFDDIWGSSGSDVFAVGDGGTILHYDGSDWFPISTGVSALLYDIWGSSGSDVFVVGSGGTILHYDGSWSEMVSGTTEHLYSVWGISELNVFSVGDNGTIIKYEPDITTTTTTPETTTTTTGICPSTEIYGEYSEEAELLRYFRDNVLTKTPEGQEIIRVYHAWSPAIVEAMKEDEEFKEDVR